MHLIEIKNKMATLKAECTINHNRTLLDKKGYNVDKCTNIQLLRGVDALNEQEYLTIMAKEIVMDMVLKYGGNITEEMINSL